MAASLDLAAGCDDAAALRAALAKLGLSCQEVPWESPCPADSPANMPTSTSSYGHVVGHVEGSRAWEVWRILEAGL